MDDRERRCKLLFDGQVTLVDWESMDSDETFALVKEHLGRDSEGADLLGRLAVVADVLSEDSVYGESLDRLASRGIDVRTCVGQIAMVFGQATLDAIDGEPWDEDYRRTVLASLPYPDGSAIAAAMLDVAELNDGLSIDELEALAVDALGVDRTDPMIERLIAGTSEHLTEMFGPLVLLAADRVVHAPSLSERAVLTHRLTEAEKRLGVLSMSVDLSAFGWVEEPRLSGRILEPFSVETGHLSWGGDDGWLDGYDVDDVLAVSIDRGGNVTIDVLDEVPPIDPALVELVRDSYHHDNAESGLPSYVVDVVFALLTERPDIFSTPTAPIRDLLEAAGLEIRGGMVATDESQWRRAARLRRQIQVHSLSGGDQQLAKDVNSVIDVFDAIVAGEAPATVDVRAALRTMADDETHTVVCAAWFDGFHVDDVESVPVEPLLDAAQRPDEVASAHLFAAMDAEHLPDLTAAERHLDLAVKADRSMLSAVDRLAWYASDRGDAKRAQSLWRRLAGNESIDQTMATLAPFTASPETLGRNARCWCGSGKKFKQCHLGQAQLAPLPDRVGWLSRKPVLWLERTVSAFDEDDYDIVDAITGSEGDHPLDQPMAVDLVLFEGGRFGQWLRRRGGLLPDDEALLAAAWATVDRSVHEVVSTDPGVGLRVRDLRTGDILDVRERTFSQSAQPSSLVCGRCVPDGESHQFIGIIFPVRPGNEASLLAVLDDGDPYEIAEWYAASMAPPQLRTREGEKVVTCDIVITADDMQALTRALDERYEIETAGEVWKETVPLDDVESVIRATFVREDDTVRISTNSHERADRILDALSDLPIEVLVDRRTPFDPTNLVDATGAPAGLPDLRSLTASAPTLPDNAIEEIAEQLERRWCDESIPALGGLTPRQAAADPTRRGDLERLITSFEPMSVPGAITMRPDNLRTLLGLDA